MKLARSLLDVLGSYGLACLLLLDLFLLTLFGTLYQVEHGLFEAQKLYFESWWVVQSSPVPLILPGGLTCMGLLAVNLFVGGMVRIQKSKRTVGVMVVHVGIALMLAAGFVKLKHSEDGHLSLFEGQSSDEFESYYLWEVAVWDASQQGPVVEHLIPNEQLVDLVAGRRRHFETASLPFDIELSGFVPNCQPMPKGPMWEAQSPEVDGYALLGQAENNEAEFNTAGLTLELRDRSTGETRTDLLWGREEHPATFRSGGKDWAIDLRHTRYQMPFTIRLEDFRKVDHPGLTMAKSFESDVTKIERGNEQKVRIQMNEPLRVDGLALFQSSFNQFPDGKERSIFSVVRNPSDYWPLYACIVIGFGLLITFVPKLWKFTRAQHSARTQPRTSP